LLDAYRELNARKMFWISLIISGVVIVAFALVGVNDKALTFLHLEWPVPAARFWYKYLFSLVVIGIWISWGAIILALISTAGMFPDLIASGSIDLYLSKPIGRLRLFFTKYLGGLLFALLQTVVFAVGCYFVFGWRSGQWRPSLFLIIPLTTLLFSYLFAICALVGVLTRSTIAALLVTILVWLLCAVANRAEQFIFQWRTMQAAEARSYERRARDADAQLARLKENPSVTNVFGIRERRIRERRDEALRQAQEARASAEKWTTAHRIAKGVVSLIPKTNETIELLDRKIFDDADLAAFRKQMAGNANAFGEPPVEAETVPTDAATADAATTDTATTGPSTNPAEAQAQAAEYGRDWEQRRQVRLEAEEAAERAARSRSVPWILGTSLGFEAVVLAIAAWVFCRRDY
jgi:hypothetical protein